MTPEQTKPEAALPAASLAPEWRSSWVGAPEAFALDQACLLVNKAFGDHCYLVGSATVHRGFRDVDVRMVFSDAKWEAMFGSHHSGQTNLFWSLICTSISEYLGRRTGLKVDFQIQRRGSVSKSDWEKPRDPLGLFVGDRHAAWRDL